MLEIGTGKKEVFPNEEKCDMWDYLAAGFCGGVAGIVDSILSH